MRWCSSWVHASSAPTSSGRPSPDYRYGDPMGASPELSLRALAARYSPTQLRTVRVALELFAIHGVGGTSLQMIADALGVTKAAVYHQFPAKDSIVIAAIEVE